ncbi:TIGR02679 family protein [Marinilactibacillus piezotolerans]|uniref:TIGR02679 family protein n=1 Tax=Marinilactibacillus piezotolerans TaxID=258723 RepID=A0A1I3WTY4_9LACT|nr:TIGR02679 family protein [Marinilactibacillus piezotolerans]SFK10663.1 TIGR02679 family protein [Marinilactibacillus piezotolerans]
MKADFALDLKVKVGYVMNEALKEAVAFFKAEAVYGKLFSAFAKKYRSLGRMSGSISLEKYSIGEIETIARFLGMRQDLLLDQNKVSIQAFEKQLAIYRFEGVSLKEIVEAYCGIHLVSNREKREAKLIKKHIFFEKQKETFPNLSYWLQYIQSQPKENRWLHQLIDQDKSEFSDLIRRLNQLVENLPKKPIRLPVFAQQQLGNPHALDRNQWLSRLFLHKLSFDMANIEESPVIEVPNSSEEYSELLLTFNLLRDDITNDITLVNILADTKVENKQAVWRAASQTHTVMNVPIRELLAVESLYPSNSSKKVHIVENSGVFSSIIDEVPQVPLICTHGQFTLATWKCLDLFDESTHFYYASDMDPEGIGMANRLIERYGNRVILWKMDAKSYEKAVSSDNDLTFRRIQQLKGLKSPMLKELKMKMVELKSPAYQEALLDEMIEELENNY